MNTKADRTPAFQRLRKARIHNTYWAKKILAAEKSGLFTESDIDEAMHWTTCACGRVDATIERESFLNWHRKVEGGCPKDWKMRVAGKNFYLAVLKSNIMAAADCLIAIEKRAREIHNGAQLRTPE